MEDQEREMRRGWREAGGVRASPEPVELGSNAPARVDLPVAFSVLAEPRHRHHCFHLPPPRQNNLLSADTATRPPPTPPPPPSAPSPFFFPWPGPCARLPPPPPHHNTQLSAYSTTRPPPPTPPQRAPASFCLSGPGPAARCTSTEPHNRWSSGSAFLPGCHVRPWCSMWPCAAPPLVEFGSSGHVSGVT